MQPSKATTTFFFTMQVLYVLEEGGATGFTSPFATLPVQQCRVGTECKVNAHVSNAIEASGVGW